MNGPPPPQAVFIENFGEEAHHAGYRLQKVNQANNCISKHDSKIGSIQERHSTRYQKNINQEILQN